LQKRFGALNDVVASRNLLSNHPDIESETALRALKAEQKARFKAARKALR
jgi:hypothetical protein